MFSFLNAGSGSNQSNHLYKLGPIHQGIMERGSKTTSDSYLLWPSRIGAFSLIMGRHYKHCDTTDFPFSYLIENKDESILVPAVNLKSIGTIRDTQKWPKRDNRTDSNLLDLINFNLLSPYTVHKMLTGRNKLIQIRDSSDKNVSTYLFDKMKIEKHALDRGIQLYEMAIWKFLGNSIITRLQERTFLNNNELQNQLNPDTTFGKGYWVDLSGIICPFQALEQLMNAIENNEVSSLEEVNSALAHLHKNYYNFEWTWVADVLKDLYGKGVDEFEISDVVKIVEKWKDCVLTMDKFLYEDAKKEYSLVKMTGFGVDGQNGARQEDFIQVRGEFEKDVTVKAIKTHMEKKEILGNEMIQRMNKLLELNFKH